MKYILILLTLTFSHLTFADISGPWSYSDGSGGLDFFLHEFGDGNQTLYIESITGTTTYVFESEEFGFVHEKDGKKTSILFSKTKKVAFLRWFNSDGTVGSSQQYHKKEDNKCN